MDSTDVRNQLLDELIGQMEDSLAEKAYPSEKKEEPVAEEVKETPKSEVDLTALDEEPISDEDMSALEATLGE